MVGQGENNRVHPKGVQESDSLIVPKKRVMIVEGRGGRKQREADPRRGHVLRSVSCRLSRHELQGDSGVQTRGMELREVRKHIADGHQDSAADD